jgi:hypothetical protein
MSIQNNNENDLIKLQKELNKQNLTAKRANGQKKKGGNLSTQNAGGTNLNNLSNLSHGTPDKNT